MTAEVVLPPNTAINISGAVAHELEIESGVYMIAYQHRISDALFIVPMGSPKPRVRADGRSRRDESAGKPFPLPLAVMEKHRVEERVTPVQVLRYDWITSPNHTPSQKEKTYIEKWRPILAGITGNLQLEQMLVYGRFAAMIRIAAAKHGVSQSSLKKKLARYFHSGGSLEAACMPHFRLPKVVVSPSKKKLGRRVEKFDARGDPTDEGQNATPDAIAAVGAFYLIKMAQVDKEEPGTRRDAPVSSYYREYCEKFVVKVVVVAETGEETVETDPVYALSERQFRYYWTKEKSAIEAAQLRAGMRNWFKDLRVTPSHARVNDLFTASTYVIDTTIGDVYLVSDEDRRRLVGRPVIYVVVDTFSYLILAVHVCLESPSSEQVKVALYQALTDKDRQAEALGLMPLVRQGLVAGVRPEAVLTDRGSDMLSMSIRSTLSESSIVHSVAAAYRADWKSLVERYFKVMNDAAIHFVPGATKGRNRERGQKDCRLDAKLTLSDLRRLLLALAARWNLTHDCSKKVPWSLSACTEPIQPTPMGLHLAGLKWLHGSGKKLTREEAIRTFLTPVTAYPRANGITADAVRYVHPWMVDNDWYFDLTKQKSIQIYRDPDKQNSCFLFGERGELLEATIVDERGDVPPHVAFADHIDGVAHARYDADDVQKQLATKERLLSREMDKAVKNGVALSTIAQAGDERAKGEKVSDIRQNRAVEIARKNGTLPKPALPSLPSPAPSTDDTADYDESIEFLHAAFQ